MNIAKAAKKGFTLIELLIVVAIIAILASVILVGLRGTREKGRDARRLTDLRNVQIGLELAFDKCGIYPGGVIGAPGVCAAPTALAAPDANGTSAASWDALRTELTTASVGISDIPYDPLAPNRHYAYIVNNHVPSAVNRSYVLRANLEDPNNRALAKDIDNNTVTFAWIQGGATTMDCNETGGSGLNFYCVGE